MTVFGADVPEGSPLNSSIFGFERHEIFGQGLGFELFETPGKDPGFDGSDQVNCIFETPDRPGRVVRRRALGSISDDVIPNAFNS
jgi:hypothetical protein